MSYTNVLNLSNQPKELEHMLKFYEQEINFLEKLLGEVVSKNTSREALTEAEHFQNQFFVQKKNIEELETRIHRHHQQTADNAKHHAGKVDERLLQENQSIGEEISSMEKIIADLRAAYKNYLVKWM
jgi:predicted  nucleic acid-binding Zn-ribbon protein